MDWRKSHQVRLACKPGLANPDLEQIWETKILMQASLKGSQDAVVLKIKKIIKNLKNISQKPVSYLRSAGLKIYK